MIGALAIRADANSHIGVGHVMRCLALAQKWQEQGGPVFFVMTEKTPAIETHLQAENINVIHLSAVPLGSSDDAEATANVCKSLDVKWMIIDGYHFDATYQQAIKRQDLPLLVIDDYGHADYYHADVVLNPNSYAHVDLYQHKSTSTQLLLGTTYALIRREFSKWAGWERNIVQIARKLLITMGGGDPDNVTLKIIQALQLLNFKDLESVIVVGAANPHYAQLQSYIKGKTLPFNLKKQVADMPGLMAWADVSVSASGSTSWEILFMGLPSLVLALADNQRPVAEALDAEGVCINLGWHEDLPPLLIAKHLSQLLASVNKRSEMSDNGRRLVDGYGTTRVFNCLQRYA